MIRRHSTKAGPERCRKTIPFLLAPLLLFAEGKANRPAYLLAGRSIEVAELARARESGAAGLLLEWDKLREAEPPQLHAYFQEAEKRGLAIWAFARFPALPENDLSVRSKSFAGLAVLFPPGKERPPEPGAFDLMMERKRKGETAGIRIRHLKQVLGAGHQLAVCLPFNEMAPETSHGTYVPITELVRDGTVDSVAVMGQERWNLHRLRLLRKQPLNAGLYIDGKAVKTEKLAGAISRAALAAASNATCSFFWVFGQSPVTEGQLIRAALKSRERAAEQRRALEEAIASGTLCLAAGTPAEKGNDQATVHGVAQSFNLSRGGECPLLQIYATIRISRGPLPPPLRVELRQDDGGNPGKTVLASTVIDAADFGPEPTYRWGTATFRPPVRLEAGRRYWLYLPKAIYPEGSYVWRIISKGATASARAWSSAYDYGKHTWVFRVFVKKEAAP